MLLGVDIGKIAEAEEEQYKMCRASRKELNDYKRNLIAALKEYKKNEAERLLLDEPNYMCSAGFLYQLDEDDKLICIGGYGSKDNVKLLKGVCVADFIVDNPFNYLTYKNRFDRDVKDQSFIFFGIKLPYISSVSEDILYDNDITSIELCYRKTGDTTPIIRQICYPPYAMSIKEASEYFSIGENMIRLWIKNNPYHPAILRVGAKEAKTLIKRVLFEKFLDEDGTFIP